MTDKQDVPDASDDVKLQKRPKKWWRSWSTSWLVVSMEHLDEPAQQETDKDAE